ncbi:hypothetical protein BKA61DRAFT_568460 [Leptodontidium sp. MPI-SDFR-AT-0119]|nr:hypothetical protein BKA61DRAFT_568460 [Leptodontidium sp. MPI-SDFR-AT-0119]
MVKSPESPPPDSKAKISPQPDRKGTEELQKGTHLNWSKEHLEEVKKPASDDESASKDNKVSLDDAIDQLKSPKEEQKPSQNVGQTSESLFSPLTRLASGNETKILVLSVDQGSTVNQTRPAELSDFAELSSGNGRISKYLDYRLEAQQAITTAPTPTQSTTPPQAQRPPSHPTATASTTVNGIINEEPKTNEEIVYSKSSSIQLNHTLDDSNGPKDRDIKDWEDYADMLLFDLHPFLDSAGDLSSCGTLGYHGVLAETTG